MRTKSEPNAVNVRSSGAATPETDHLMKSIPENPGHGNTRNEGDRAFLDGISRVSLRADNPDALAADLRADDFRDESAVYEARHHLFDPTRDIHILTYTSGVLKVFGSSWTIVRPVITGLADRGLVR